MKRNSYFFGRCGGNSFFSNRACWINDPDIQRWRESLFSNSRNIWMNDSDNENSSAIDILNNRYAKGEISKEEYDRMKEDISENFN